MIYPLQPSETTIVTQTSGNYTNYNFKNLKFDHKTGNPEDFLVQTQIKAAQAYPDPVFAPIPTANPPSDRREIDRVAAANQILLDNAVNERNRRIKENFTNVMPNFIKRKLLDQNETATVQDLCTVARRQMVVFELCPSEDWSRDAFNEVSSSLSENLVGAPTNLTQQQEELKQQQNDFSNKISSLNNNQTINQNYTRNNQQQYYRGNNRFNNPREFRGRGDFNRGRGRFNNNRGYYDINYNRFNNPRLQESSINGHIAQTGYTKQTCHICGYPNHYARDFNQRKPAHRNQQIPCQTAPKNQ